MQHQAYPNETGANKSRGNSPDLIFQPTSFHQSMK